MKAKNYVVRYLKGKKSCGDVRAYSYGFFRHILDMPGRELEWSEKFEVFAEFFREAEKRKGTTDFSFWEATSAIFDVLSEEKFI